MPNDLPKAAAAEFIGTFALVFIGVLSVTQTTLSGQPTGFSNLVNIALGFGLTITVMVAALGYISGGHFNPAVTVAFVATGRQKPAVGLVYIVAQLLGAFAAAGLLAGAITTPIMTAAAPALAELVDPMTGLVLELVATFFLVLVILGTAVDPRAPRGLFPLAIGFTVALDIMAIGTLTGGAMNPARALAPALVCGVMANHWIYWAGPIGGALLAAVVYEGVFKEKPNAAAAQADESTD